ncbi:hypothetical protein PLICRDRAFT_170985 [Plicaturopsis crispa FD-325 SS-3]|nr:hypothetical protein PLICRDRAFT_170985 [Plicaturopsis crispa FD-325 SS-3]
MSSHIAAPMSKAIAHLASHNAAPYGMNSLSRAAVVPKVIPNTAVSSSSKSPSRPVITLQGRKRIIPTFAKKSSGKPKKTTVHSDVPHRLVSQSLSTFLSKTAAARSKAEARKSSNKEQQRDQGEPTSDVTVVGGKSLRTPADAAVTTLARDIIRALATSRAKKGGSYLTGFALPVVHSGTLSSSPLRQ